MKYNLFLILILFNSCKSKNTQHEFTSLSQFYNVAFNLELIENNPIVVLNNKYVGLYSEINLNDIKHKSIDKKSISIVPKDYNYLNDYFGVNAENGIIVINNMRAFHCGGYSPKHIFLLDNKEIDLEEMIKQNDNKLYYINEFKQLKNKDNYNVEITILSRNKREIEAISKIKKTPL